jgi:hypothetical protein
MAIRHRLKRLRKNSGLDFVLKGRGQVSQYFWDVSIEETRKENKVGTLSERFVSGHGFSRAAKGVWKPGL